MDALTTFELAAESLMQQLNSDLPFADLTDSLGDEARQLPQAVSNPRNSRALP